jgi:lysine 2,3-aminomutase
VSTWDGKELLNYEALGRTTYEEFENGVNIMDTFIGRKGVFVPKLIIVDNKGDHIETTNRTKLPRFEKIKKCDQLGYEVFENDMPLTNPADIIDILDDQFLKSTH